MTKHIKIKRRPRPQAKLITSKSRRKAEGLHCKVPMLIRKPAAAEREVCACNFAPQHISNHHHCLGSNPLYSAAKGWHFAIKELDDKCAWQMQRHMLKC